MADIYSLVFFLICALCTFVGFYILLSDPKSGINVIFWIVCSCLALWSYGFSLAINAPTEAVCLAGRRVAAVGWSVIFSFVVHFILLLSGKEKVLSRGWAYVALYLPAAVSLYIFAISNRMALIQYNLVPTPQGWVNVAVNNGWDILYYVYYISFFFYSYYLLWHWHRHAKNEITKKQARLIKFSWIASIVIGSTDIFYNTLVPGANLPQMAPIAFMLPLVTISYCIRKYRFMRVRGLEDSKIILTSTPQNATYDYLSFAFCAGGFLYYLSCYMMQDKFTAAEVLPTSILLFLAGIVVQVATRIKTDHRILEAMYIIAVVLSIPLVTLHFSSGAGITIWAFPFILLIFSMMFKRLLVLISTAVSIFLTQGLLWYAKPVVSVQVDGSDHAGRIGLFVIGICVAFFVHKAFVLRLKENEKQIECQKLIAEISAELVSIDLSNQDEKIEYFLQRIGTYYGADRAMIIPYLPPDDSSWLEYCWSRKGGEQVDFAYAGPAREDAGVPEGLRKAPPELSVGVSVQKDEESGSVTVCVPIDINGEVAAHFRLESVKGAEVWQEDQMRRLKILTNILADSMERIRAEAKAHFLAYYDYLTNLPNRSLFRDRVNQAVAFAQRAEKALSVVFLDLDGFKSINDTMGHQGGDALIREVAAALVGRLRKTDTVARFGGDEFVMLLNHLKSPEDILAIMKEVMDLFSRPFFVGGQEMFITASAGVAVYPVDGSDTDALIKSADIAMYHAKEKGKNQYVMCSPDMRDDVHLKMHLTNGLYRALERGEMEVYYQPQVDLQTGKIVGLEALLRWHHPELGMVSPGVFIPLAEQSGLINPIGEWVLQTACGQNMAWQRMGLPRVRVAVNISVNQFRNPRLKDQVQRVLETTGLNPEDLELEITESVAIREAGYIVSVLNELKKLNVRISIDDFGTEYSSLSRLKMLPVDRIKMDMQFVREIEHSEKDKAISKVIINLAKSLGMRVIAEGVETQGQLDFLSRKMCDEVQGFYYYRPMPARDVEKLLMAQRPVPAEA